MTLVNIDLRNAGHETGPDDRVIFYSLLVREGEFGTISTAPVTVWLEDGQATVDLAPGPVGVQIIAGQVADTRVKEGRVPMEGPTTLNVVLTLFPEYSDAIRVQFLAAIHQAQDTALTRIDAEVAVAVDAEMSGVTAMSQEALSRAKNAEGVAATANVKSTSATSTASTAASTASNAAARVTALEAMGGLSPQSPVDGQTANLLTQPDTLTRAALGALTIGSTTTPAQETATLGPELITSTGWSLGEGWSGNFADGFTKTPGATAPLVWTPPFATGTTLYLVEWKWDGTSTHQDVYAGYDVYLGGAYAGITYQGAAPSNTDYSRAIRSLADGTLEFRPWDTFEGRIHSISVREVAGTSTLPPTVWRDSDNNRSGEMRFTHGTNHSIFIGVDSGKYNISGFRNASVGAFSMANNVSGFLNSAFGYNALHQLTSGSRNAAFGYQSLASTTSGDRNVGVGPFALTRNTTGQRNIAIGVDVLWKSTNSDDNIGLGYLTMTELGDNGAKTQGNVAIGRYAMRQAKTGNRNVAIGEEAAYNTQGDGSIAIGTRAMWRNLGAESIAIGTQTLENLNATSAQQGQTAIGHRALRRGFSSTQFNRNTAVGFESGENLLRGRNTAVGHQALRGDPAVEISGTQGSRNTAIGDSAGSAVTTGEMNTFIGSSAGTSVTTGSNNVIIGVATGTPTMSNTLNIGNVLWGDLATKRFSVDVENPTARMHLPTGGTEPGSAPLKLTSSTNLLSAPEPGAFEFSSGRLYFTPSTGVRREIAFVSPEPEP